MCEVGALLSNLKRSYCSQVDSASDVIELIERGKLRYENVANEGKLLLGT